MSKTKGRPKGSEKDDSKALSAMADMIHADPALKPTTAMRRHNFKIGDAEIRRLQVKWKQRRGVLLATAKARAEARQTREASTSVPVVRTALGAAAEMARMASEIYNSPEMRMAREFHASPAMRTIRETLNSPEMKLIREMQNDPAIRIMREVAEERARINRALGGW